MGVWPYHPDGYGSLQYVNHSFVDLNGYSKEEALGQPAMNILKYHDGKWVSVCVGGGVGDVQRWNIIRMSSSLPLFLPLSPHSLPPPIFLLFFPPPTSPTLLSTLGKWTQSGKCKARTSNVCMWLTDIHCDDHNLHIPM